MITEKLNILRGLILIDKKPLTKEMADINRRFINKYPATMINNCSEF